MLGAAGDDARGFALVNKIRSLAPAPGARTALPKFGLSKVLAAHVLSDGPALAGPAGTSVSVAGWLLLRAADGWLALDEIGLPGRRTMRIGEFRAGHKLTEPETNRCVLERWLGENEARLLEYAAA